MLMSKPPALSFMGSATSAFQAHPLWKEPSATSDWGEAVLKNLNGETSGIKRSLVKKTLPHFFLKAERYIQRSAALGETMYRISLEMPRICLRIGEFDEQHMIENVRAFGLIHKYEMEPMVTMQHFTLPLSLDTGNGGWLHPDIVRYTRYATQQIARFLNDKTKMNRALESVLPKRERERIIERDGLVKYFVSINEPWTAVFRAFLTGEFPPFKKLRFDLVKRALNAMVEAHDAIRTTLQEANAKAKMPTYSKPQIGVSYNWQYLEGLFSSLSHYFGEAKITDMFERDGNHTDFLAEQYYCRVKFPFFFVKYKDLDYGDHPALGDMYPQGITSVLKSMHERYPAKDIFVTEIGFADHDDLRRPYWLLETVRAIREAATAGVPIRGILHWSLVTNLEWGEGMEVKFGLFDEADLDNPLWKSYGSGDQIRGWEAWRVAVDTMLYPSDANEIIFDEATEKARRQYEKRKTELAKLAK